jgi:hypothetical protein
MTPSEAIEHGASKGLHVAWCPDMKLLIVGRKRQKVNEIELFTDAITIAEHEGLWFLMNTIRSRALEP